MSYIDRIEEAKKKLKDAENNKIRYEEKLEVSRKKLDEVKEEMKKYGVTPETITEEITKLDKGINDSLKLIEQKLESLECK